MVSALFREPGREGKGPGARAFGRHLCVTSGGSVGKESDCHAGDPGSIPEWGRSPGGGNGNPLQYSCLEMSMDRDPMATVHGIAKSQT